MFVRDMDLAAHNALDNRRLEVVAGRVDLCRGAQLAMDTTLVFFLRWDGTARARAANHDGAALEDARRRKQAGEGGRARLVVLAVEVGGSGAAQFLTALAKACAQEVPQVLQGRAETAWVKQWSAILACTAAWSLAQARGPFGPRGFEGSSLLVNVVLSSLALSFSEFLTVSVSRDV